jgi:hypothetical protein
MEFGHAVISIAAQGEFEDGVRPPPLSLTRPDRSVDCEVSALQRKAMPHHHQPIEHGLRMAALT